MSTPAGGCVTFLGPPEHTAVDWAQHSRASMSHGSRGLRLRLQWRQGELLLRPKGEASWAPLLGFLTAASSLCLHATFPLCPASPFCKDACHIAWGPTLIALFELGHLQRPCFQIRLCWQVAEVGTSALSAGDTVQFIM